MDQSDWLAHKLTENSVGWVKQKEWSRRVILAEDKIRQKDVFPPVSGN